MVGNRWESSNRPLFVKTIWKDGHHHVVFKKEEDRNAPTARSTKRNLVSCRSGKKNPSLSYETSSNFKVPSVKLLLASLRNIKSDQKSKRYKTETPEFTKSAVTVDITPSDSVRYNDLNKQVIFKNEKKSLNFTTKSNSIDVNHFYRERESIPTPPPFSYDSYCMEPFNNNLSERVMIWLDLAIQNHKDVKFAEFKKRVVTAQPCPLTQRKTMIRHEEIKKDVRQTVENATLDSPLVTSHMEYEYLEPTIEEKNRCVRASTSKRQLHIFLPNLPKKYSESGSFLSSKSGSQLLQTNQM